MSKSYLNDVFARYEAQSAREAQSFKKREMQKLEDGGFITPDYVQMAQPNAEPAKKERQILKESEDYINGKTDTITNKKTNENIKRPTVWGWLSKKIFY